MTPEQREELFAEATEILIQSVISFDDDPSNAAADIEVAREFLDQHFARPFQEAEEEAASSGSVDED